MKILLGMPCMRTIPHRTVISLLATCQKGVVEPILVEGSLVYDARDTIVKFAVENNYDYILFADSDMVFGADDLKKLLVHEADICSGLYVKRDGSGENVAYSRIITRRRFPFRKPELTVDKRTSGYGRVAACGFGFALIKTETVKCMLKHYKSLFEPYKGLGEDAAFCHRAAKCGFDIYIDRDVKLGHIGEKVFE